MTFPCYRECILKTAKALVEDTKLLVSGAGASQEKLAQAAQSSVSTITKLADVVKLGAASLGSEDPETQVWTWLSGPHKRSTSQNPSGTTQSEQISNCKLFDCWGYNRL